MGGGGGGGCPLLLDCMLTCVTLLENILKSTACVQAYHSLQTLNTINTLGLYVCVEPERQREMATIFQDTMLQDTKLK